MLFMIENGNDQSNTIVINGVHTSVLQLGSIVDHIYRNPCLLSGMIIMFCWIINKSNTEFYSYTIEENNKMEELSVLMLYKIHLSLGSVGILVYL